MTKRELITKKEDILKSGRDLMLGKGYSAVSVDEICKSAGVTKGCFFHHFKNKEELARELVERFTGEIIAFMDKGSCCASDDPLDRVYAYVDCVIKMACDPHSKGCLVGTLVQERWDSTSKLSEICHESMKRFVGAFKNCLEDAGAKYRPACCNYNELAEYFVSVMQGSMVMIKASHDHSIMERNLVHFKQYLKSQFGR